MLQLLTCHKSSILCESSRVAPGAYLAEMSTSRPLVTLQREYKASFFFLLVEANMDRVEIPVGGVVASAQ